jgi:hypothetical protein
MEKNFDRILHIWVKKIDIASVQEEQGQKKSTNKVSTYNNKYCHGGKK